MKKYKNILLVSLVVVVITTSGCTPITPVQKEIIEVSAVSSTSLLSSAQVFTVQGLHMTVPEKYSVIKVEKEKVYIKTDDTEHRVTLILEVLPQGSWSNQELKDFFISNSPLVDSQSITIFNDESMADCTVGCFTGIVGKQAFSFIWEINSSENPPVPTPEDPDAGLWWVPKTKTTQQDLLNILRTAIFN